MMMRYVFLLLALALPQILASPAMGAAQVSREGGRVAIVDRTGERWDVTQAETLGFVPARFQFGIGRNAIPPVDDSRVRPAPEATGANPRVIALESGGEARAWSVPRLAHHEIANSRLGGRPVAAAY